MAVCCGIFLLAACKPKDERRLVVYSSGPRPLAESICSIFERRHGVRVELFTATTGQIMAKVEAEKYNPRADVLLLAAEAPAYGLKQSGRLHAYTPKTLKNPRASWADKEGFYHAVGAAAVGIAFRAGETDPDATWSSVLRCGVAVGKGRVAMPSPSRSGTAGDFLLALHERMGAEFWAAFREARLRGFEIVGSNSQAITGLGIRAYDAVYCAADYIICREIARGESLTIHFPPEGALYVLRPVMILASSRRIPLAEKFVDYCFSDEVQELIAAEHLLPMSQAVRLSDVRAQFPVPEPMQLDVAAAVNGQRELVRRFQYEVERAIPR